MPGCATFFALNLNRGDRPSHNITTQFFGRIYNLDYPLPWYNTLVWTAITVSPLMVLLGIGGHRVERAPLAQRPGEHPLGPASGRR